MVKYRCNTLLVNSDYFSTVKDLRIIGYAILENAGGIVTDFNGNEITYGKKDFKNPSIILKRSKNL